MCYTVSVECGKKILGIDFGLKRVGFAVCDTLRILAVPLPAYATKSMRDSVDYATGVCAEQDVGGVVVGLPLNMDGSESVQSGRARAFARTLGKVTGLDVALYDERLTTLEADDLLKEAGIKRSDDRKKLVDSMAAKVILQGYIENKNQIRESTAMEEVKDQNVELIDDEVITLYDDNNNPVDFNEVAVVEYQGEFYALMQPVAPMEGLSEDEAIIFKIVQKDDETDEFEPITDEAVLDAVFNEYLKAEAECCDDCDCGCGCEHDCSCGCDD